MKKFSDFKPVKKKIFEAESNLPSNYEDMSKEELLKLCHYTNLQPLWARDNLTKSNKLI